MSVTIVIAAHNSASTLESAILSVVRQAHRLELAVIDDGSTDGTQSMLEQYSGRILTRRQERGGVSSARNAGARLCETTHIAFLDADDRLLPDWSVHVLKALATDTPLLSGGALIKDATSGVTSVQMPSLLGPAFGHLTASFLAGTYVVKRGLFWQVSGFDVDIAYGEQYELALRLAPLCADAATLLVPLVLINRDRSAEARGRYHEKRLESVLRQLRKHDSLLASDRSFRADLESVGGYSAASLGRFDTARALYRKSIRSAPTRWGTYARYAAAAVPLLRTKIWDQPRE